MISTNNFLDRQGDLPILNNYSSQVCILDSRSCFNLNYWTAWLNLNFTLISKSSTLFN